MSEEQNEIPQPLPAVTLIVPKRRYSSLVSIVFRVTLASLLLGVGVFAVVYSVNKSESSESITNPNSTDYVPPGYFNFNQTQTCLSGLLTEEYLSTSTDTESLDENDPHRVSKTEISWIQDNSHRRILHRVGLSDADWRYTYFVYEKYTIKASKTSCQLDANRAGYSNFLNSFGLGNLRRTRSEKIKINGTYVDVDLYQGLPTKTTAYDERQPYLAMAYTQPNQSLVYTWQAYFTQTPQSSLYSVEYWLPTVESVVPDASIFFILPPSCLANGIKPAHY
jgi:hypothetical protein